jgi:nucleoside-diphosphate-sugar epimerase/ketosteroid isomerase-like protein
MVVRVFVAGGTGVIGRRLVPQLVARGHQVTATTTSAAKLGLLHELGAAEASGVSHVAAQGVAIFNGIREGGWVKTEEDPLWAEVGTEAVSHLEEVVVNAGGAVLRYGGLYGPGANEDQIKLVRKRLFPLIGGGTGYFSWVYVDDAASATVLAVEQQAAGVFNIVDDEPAPVSQWLPYLAECVGAKPPRRLPAWLARPLAGERLSPLERAVFVLREVFAFGFGEIASAVGRSEAACRQLAVRARRHMDEGRLRFEAGRREREELAGRFFVAFREGDVDGLQELLAADVQLVTDAGGKAPALPRSIIGAQKVARVLASVFPRLDQIDVTLEPREMNGQPGAIFRDRDGKVLTTVTLDVLDGQIQMIRSVTNPDKLGHVGPVADAWAVAREVNQARRAAD